MEHPSENLLQPTFVHPDSPTLHQAHPPQSQAQGHVSQVSPFHQHVADASATGEYSQPGQQYEDFLLVPSESSPYQAQTYGEDFLQGVDIPEADLGLDPNFTSQPFNARAFSDEDFVSAWADFNPPPQPRPLVGHKASPPMIPSDDRIVVLQSRLQTIEEDVELYMNYVGETVDKNMKSIHEHADRLNSRFLALRKDIESGKANRRGQKNR